MTALRHALRDVLHDPYLDRGIAGPVLLDRVRARESHIRGRRRTGTVLASAVAAVLVAGGAGLFASWSTPVVGTPLAQTADAPGSAAADPAVAPPPAGAVPGDFEGGTDGWRAIDTAVQAGPQPVTQWAATGLKSLKVDILLDRPDYYLGRTADADLTGARTLSATVRIAPGADVDPGMLARMYVKSGETWTWAEGPSTVLTSSGSTVGIAMSTIPEPGAVREVGVHLLVPSSSAGSTAIYLDDVRVG